MHLTCDNCNKSFTRNYITRKNCEHSFCSMSCSAIYTNKHRTSSSYRQLEGSCKGCDKKIRSVLTWCKECREHRTKYGDDKTLGEVIYLNHHKSSAFALVRERARRKAKSLGWNSCKYCGYDKHIEICHIKPISSYPLETLVSEVNSEENLLPLCPNCHWEFDNLN
jgi:5-methylcytosine-specific restriction endonuclease McrA